MKAILAIAPAIFVAACASTNGSSSSPMGSSATRYWTGVSDSVDAFRHDNVVCSARAQKFGNLTSAPDNRIDRPMQKWPNETAQETYEQCMHDNGWRSAG